MKSKRQQNLDIAKACGWNRFCTHKVVGRVVDYGHPPKDRCKYETPLLDYVNDLNAMHAAEKILGKKTDSYIQWLAEITKDVGMLPTLATAAQRAEAFLRTLNLWEE